MKKLLGKATKSLVVESSAVDYTDQPDFLNQILEFNSNPENLNPFEVLEKLMTIEKRLGRIRDIDKGPRTIDLDLLFYSTQKILKNSQLPHPRLFERSFIVQPLRELPCYKFLKKEFIFPNKFENSCTAYQLAKIKPIV